MAIPRKKWRQESWNPMTGCTKVSEGCKRCYVPLQIAHLTGRPSVPYFQNGFVPTVHQALIERPLHWRMPRLVTVANMTDIFHESYPLDLIQRLFFIMGRCPQHQFLLLTKRTGRLTAIAKDLTWTDNMWLGVSVENANYLDRIDHIRSVPAKNRWVAFEPLIDKIVGATLTDISWVVVAPGSHSQRSVHYAEWARIIRDDCVRSSIPLFIKDSAGYYEERWTGADELDGTLWNQMPQSLKIYGTAFLQEWATKAKNILEATIQQQQSTSQCTPTT